MSTTTILETGSALPVGTWKLDPVHSHVGFAVEYGVGTFRGSFAGVEASLQIDDDGDVVLTGSAPVDAVWGLGYKPATRKGKSEDMANTRSAKKAARQAVRRTEVNKARRSRVRSYVRKVEEAIAAGDQAAARAALEDAQPELMRGARKKVLHKNAAARKVSRLSKRVKSMTS